MSLLLERGERVKASKDIMLREIAGEYLLIPVGPMAMKVHGMIGLTESGMLLWKKLQEDCTEAELIDSLLSEYEVDRETAAQDVRAFLEKMDQVGILERNEKETSK